MEVFHPDAAQNKTVTKRRSDFLRADVSYRSLLVVLIPTPLFFCAAAVGSDLKASRCVIPAGAMLRRRGEKEKESGAGSQRAAAAAAVRAGCVTVNKKKTKQATRTPPKKIPTDKVIISQTIYSRRKKNATVAIFRYIEF